MGSKTKLKGFVASPSIFSEASSSSSSSSEASSSRSTLPAADDSMDDASSNNSHSDEAEEEEEVSEELDSISSASSYPPPQPNIDLTKAKTKLHHIAKTLRATAKKTKTFEVQKQVKKLKGFQKKVNLADQASLAEKELNALKSIDINLLAGRALITKMVKAKLLPRPAEMGSAEEEGEYMYLGMVKEEELLGEDVLSGSVVTDGDKALERAKAKITSSKVLADEVGKFVDELKKLVGLETVGKKEEVEAKAKAKAKQEEEEEDQDEREWSGSEEEDESDDEAPRRLPLADDDDNEDEEDVDEEELMRIGKEKMKALGDLSQWDDMIGSDSAAESGSESDSDNEEAEQRRSSKSKHQSNDSDASDSEDDSASDSGSSSEEDSDSDSDSSSSSSERPRKRKSTTSASERSSKKSKKSSASSTFLPSLSSGFIAGRSDDEWSDAEADLADRDLGGKKERKNRMGQRARKALYEKKYGKNANHIKMREKQKVAKPERNSTRASGARTGGGGGDGSGRQRPPAFQAPTKRDGGWGGPVAPLPKQPKQPKRPYVPRSEPISAPPAAAAVQSGAKASGGKAAGGESKSQEMHPSWIAKQKQKELMAQVKPQGKKVVFD